MGYTPAGPYKSNPCKPGSSVPSYIHRWMHTGSHHLLKALGAESLSLPLSRYLYTMIIRALAIVLISEHRQLPRATTIHTPTHSQPWYLQNGALVKAVGAGPALQGREGHVPSTQRGDVAKLLSAEGHMLVLTGPQVLPLPFPVRLPAGSAVVLVWYPGPAGAAALVNGKALRPAGVELQPHVGDFVRLPW